MAEHTPRVAGTVERSRRAESVRWVGSIAAAVLLHAGAAAAMLVDFGARPAESAAAPPLAAMSVELADLPSAPEPRASETPPGPEQVEQRVQPKPQPRQRQFDPPPEARAAPPPDALAARPEDEPESEQQVAADRTSAAPSSMAQTQDALQAPVEGSPSDQGASAIQTWENTLLTHLERHKRYPGGAQMRRQEDVIYLRFTMDRSGKVLHWHIARSRGYAALDEEVNALIQRASPLPPPPDEMGGTLIDMVVPVEFFLRRNLARRGR
ncbi:energy transducer TonB [Stenotrophomonas sp. MMGLT7]|uniref:energy transducer TonB family protein n=1 Tax=Stenotrophomonas sp. MMGLT7 TaxID=2901227 RepID=UPI001E5D6252|nr:energy transducer TonB [Stenotrophomonas sp. MMGLT7]MCD7098230.1 energy transducer TonB [Stenotrophomonas sp. MMGLT7]